MPAGDGDRLPQQLREGTPADPFGDQRQDDIAGGAE